MFATVGTDHHPFDRLVAWLDAFSADHPDVSAFVQTGTSFPPAHAGWCAYLGFPDLRARIAGASVVVCHGGPATVMDARAAGHLPIVVPRRHDLGEHVDDHQVRFCTWMHQRGQLVMVDDEDQFRRRLAEAQSEPARYAIDRDHSVPPGVRCFGDLVDGLLS